MSEAMVLLDPTSERSPVARALTARVPPPAVSERCSGWRARRCLRG